MKKVVKITESEINRLVNRILNENTLYPRTKDEFMKIYNMNEKYPCNYENGIFKIGERDQLNAPEKDDFEIKDGSPGHIYHDAIKIYFAPNPKFDGHKPVAIVLF
jgi:hypothetical protein